MFPILRRALILPALALLLAAPIARAAPVVIIPPAAVKELAYGSDGKALWTTDWANQLMIRTGDGKSVKYRGALPREEVSGDILPMPLSGLHVLKDGSFMVGASAGNLRWFEPPREGQPLQLRRELAAPEIKPRDGATEKSEAITPELWLARGGTSSFNSLAISPDEKRVAASISVSPFSGIMARLSFSTPNIVVVRVWNLASGAIESEQRIDTRGLDSLMATGQVQPQALAQTRVSRNNNQRLGWADDRTLVIADGLSLRRFDATTGVQVGDWQPANASLAVARARIMRQPFYASRPAAQRDILIKSAQPRAFDAEAQRLLALSDDGAQLLVWDGGRSLLTLWDSATETVEVLNDGGEFTPQKAKFSPDGTKVAAWNRDEIRSWRNKSRVSDRQISTGLVAIPPSEGMPVWDVALTNERIAWARGTEDVFSIRFSPVARINRGPARLEDLRALPPTPQANGAK